MRRREFIGLVGGAAAWPFAARAQQPAMPVIGYLSSRSSESDASMLVAFRRGLGEVGYVEGQNLTIEYRFADGQYDRMAALATDLIGRKVAAIAFVGARRIAESATWQQFQTSNIPIVFNSGTDPVLSGLVPSLNRPGGNITGIYSFVGALTAKNLGLLHELVPNGKTIAVLADASGLDVAVVKDVREAAAALGLQLMILNANTQEQIDAAFVGMNRQRADAMLIASNPLFVIYAKEIAALAARHKLPAIFARREFVEAGGLMSYGDDVADVYRQLGNYVARILKGEKPADLPILQPTKFELVINLKTAKALGLEVPANLLALADEVIE